MNFHPAAFTGYSRGMISTWFFHAPSRTLFDCGEGCVAELDNTVFAIEKVFISHGHYDHVSGLISVLMRRANGRGDNNKPIMVYYPPCPEMTFLIRYFESICLVENVFWQEIKPDDEILYDNSRVVRVIKTNHCKESLAFQFLTKRKKLKEEYGKLSQAELVNLKKTSSISDEVVFSEFLYTGDTGVMEFPGCETMFCECTFYGDEKKNDSHMDLGSLVVPKEVKNLVLFHGSSRYRVEDIVPKIIGRNWTTGCSVYLWHENSLHAIIVESRLDA